MTILITAIVCTAVEFIVGTIYLERERRRARAIAARFGVQVPDDEAPAGPPLCVACGAEVLEQILWSYGKEDEAPHLMRVLNLCEECGYRVAQEIA